MAMMKDSHSFRRAANLMQVPLPYITGMVNTIFIVHPNRSHNLYPASSSRFQVGKENVHLWAICTPTRCNVPVLPLVDNELLNYSSRELNYDSRDWCSWTLLGVITRNARNWFWISSLKVTQFQFTGKRGKAPKNSTLYDELEFVPIYYQTDD